MLYPWWLSSSVGNGKGKKAKTKANFYFHNLTVILFTLLTLPSLQFLGEECLHQLPESLLYWHRSGDEGNLYK